MRKEGKTALSGSTSEPENAHEGLAPGFRDRLLEVASRLGGRKAAAESCGLSISQFNRLVSGDNKPKLAQMARLAVAADADLRWLATGECRDSTEGAHPPSGQLVDDFLLLPRYEIRAAAGSGALVHSEQVVDYLAFKRDWVVNRLRRNPADLVLIEAFGNSMEPKIRHGDLLLLDTGVERIRDHAIYALNVAGELVVKYVSRRPTGTVRVFSENPTYPPDELSPDEANELVVVGQVIWAGGVL